MARNASKTEEKHDDVADIMAWESGEMDQEQTVAFFQRIIDSGLAWQLQGCYGRTAVRLIEAGHCHAGSR